MSEKRLALKKGINNPCESGGAMSFYRGDFEPVTVLPEDGQRTIERAAKVLDAVRAGGCSKDTDEACATLSKALRDLLPDPEPEPELLPCGWCGAKAENTNARYTSIRCSNQQCPIRLTAITAEAWNRRATPPPADKPKCACAERYPSQGHPPDCPTQREQSEPDNQEPEPPTCQAQSSTSMSYTACGNQLPCIVHDLPTCPEGHEMGLNEANNTYWLACRGKHGECWSAPVRTTKQLALEEALRWFGKGGAT